MALSKYAIKIFSDLEKKWFGNKTDLERRAIVQAKIYQSERKIKKDFDEVIRPSIFRMVEMKWDELGRDKQKLKEWIRINFSEWKNLDDYKQAINDAYKSITR